MTNIRPPRAQDRLPVVGPIFVGPSPLAKVVVRVSVAALSCLALSRANPFVAFGVTSLVSIPGAALSLAGNSAISLLQDGPTVDSVLTTTAGAVFSWITLTGDFYFGIADRHGF